MATFSESHAGQRVLRSGLSSKDARLVVILLSEIRAIFVFHCEIPPPD